MNTQNRRMFAGAALAALLSGLSGCISPIQVSTDGRLIIFMEPKSQVVPVGGPASFSIVAKHARRSTNALTYQWMFNGVVIPGATSTNYTIPSVNFTDVGQYTVLVTGSSLLSYPANLAVYLSVGNQGTWQSPIGWFTNESSFTCPSGGTFNKGYYPLDPNTRVIALFYGPNVSSQTGPFKNTTGATTLTVDTFSSDNGTADTGIRIKNNWVPYSYICNDDFTPVVNPPQTDRKQSKHTLTLQALKTYKVSIFYKSASPPPNGANGKITFNWKYEQ